MTKKTTFYEKNNIYLTSMYVPSLISIPLVLSNICNHDG